MILFFLVANMLLRVILAVDDIRRVQIDSLPETVDDLKTLLKGKLNLTDNIIVQFSDPEFNNEFCNLTDISELPLERASLKIILKEQPSSPPSVSSLDTCGSEQPASGSSVESPSTSHTKHWPHPFMIPSFAYDVELKIRKGNEACAKDGSLLTVTPAMKSNILDRVGSTMFEFNKYPTAKQIEDVAKALVDKHPCLRDPGSSDGWQSWKFAFGFKMGNLRQKYRLAGCPELTVNQKRSSDSGNKTKKIKRAKRSEINFLPDVPQGQTPNSLEDERKTLIEEMQKVRKDWKMIDALMGSTFALRRKEIVDDEPPVSEVAERWPALLSERQVISVM